MRRTSFLLALLLASPALAQIRPPIADPWHGHLVEGRVVDAAGHGVGGVIVERASDASGREPYSAGAYRATTDASGAFRFQFSGLGPSTGRTWYLVARRSGCAPIVVTVQLQPGPVPPSNREGDVARDVVIRWRCEPIRGSDPSTPGAAAGAVRR